MCSRHLPPRHAIPLSRVVPAVRPVVHEHLSGRRVPPKAVSIRGAGQRHRPRCRRPRRSAGPSRRCASRRRPGWRWSRRRGGPVPRRGPQRRGRRLPVGRRFVGTPRVGFGTSEYGRDYRVGLRPCSARSGESEPRAGRRCAAAGEFDAGSRGQRVPRPGRRWAGRRGSASETTCCSGSRLRAGARITSVFRYMGSMV